MRTVFMTEDRQLKAIQLAKEACLNEKMQTSPRDIAGHIKMGFDALYGPCWHCIVGRSFGSFVTHGKPQCLIKFFKVGIFRKGQLYILLRRSVGYHAFQDRIIHSIKFFECIIKQHISLY